LLNKKNSIDGVAHIQNFIDSNDGRLRGENGLRGDRRPQWNTRGEMKDEVSPPSENTPDVIPVVDEFITDESLRCRNCDFKGVEITSFNSHVKNAHSHSVRPEVLNNVTNLKTCPQQKACRCISRKQSQVRYPCISGEQVKVRSHFAFANDINRAKRYFLSSLGLLRRSAKRRASVKKWGQKKNLRRNGGHGECRYDNIGDAKRSTILCYAPKRRGPFGNDVDYANEFRDKGCILKTSPSFDDLVYVNMFFEAMF